MKKLIVLITVLSFLVSLAFAETSNKSLLNTPDEQLSFQELRQKYQQKLKDIDLRQAEEEAAEMFNLSPEEQELLVTDNSSLSKADIRKKYETKLILINDLSQKIGKLRHRKDDYKLGAICTAVIGGLWFIRGTVFAQSYYDGIIAVGSFFPFAAAGGFGIARRVVSKKLDILEKELVRERRIALQILEILEE